MKHCYGFALILLGCTGTCLAEEFAELPAGYDWHTDFPAQTAVPVPAGWFINQEQQGSTSTLYITQDNLGTAGQFSTGYSLSYTENFSSVDSSGPWQHAQELMASTTTDKPIIREVWINLYSTPGVIGMGVVYSDPQSASVVHQYVVVDEVRDSLRVMTFKAPTSTWTSAWQHGELMLTHGTTMETVTAFDQSAIGPLR